MEEKKMWKIFRKKNYITEEEFDLTLKSNFYGVSMDMLELTNKVDRLEREAIVNKEVLVAVISLFKSGILTKAQLSKKLEIDSKSYEIGLLLENAVSELCYN